MNYVDGWESCSNTDLKDFDKKACKSDVIVLCLGELPATEKPGDIRSLDLPKEQLALVERALATKKPVVLVLLEGRPRIIHNVVDASSAILQAYLPGDYGAEAIAGILFGDINPSGKLPYSYPKYSGVIEHYDLKKSEMRSGKSSKFDAYDPEWDFGFGLSYSTFTYSAIRMDKTTFVGKDSVLVSVDVKNTSSVKGKEVVQLYVADLVSSSATWGKRLKNYTKIELAPGEVKTVNFVLSEKDIIFVGPQNNWISESGEFEIIIGDERKRLNYIK
jgi:beta-glucosidase